MTSAFYFQVIDNDNGAHMRPMPGMISFSTSGPPVMAYSLSCYQL